MATRKTEFKLRCLYFHCIAPNLLKRLSIKLVYRPAGMRSFKSRAHNFQLYLGCRYRNFPIAPGTQVTTNPPPPFALQRYILLVAYLRIFCCYLPISLCGVALVQLPFGEMATEIPLPSQAPLRPLHSFRIISVIANFVYTPKEKYSKTILFATLSGGLVEIVVACKLCS